MKARTMGRLGFRNSRAAELARLDRRPERKREDRAMYHVWPDFELKPLINRTISTVKGDAAHNAFAALGSEIVTFASTSTKDGLRQC
jgi:hypothetical protein